MTNLLIGNIISLAAACFTLASAWSADRKRIYLYQALQCLLHAAANVFFLSASGVTTFVLCTVRNLLLAKDRFGKLSCALFAVSVAAIGLIANNRGWLGVLPVATTALYTVLCLYTKKTRAIKLNVTSNLILWTVYDILIGDYVSFAVDTGSAAAGAVSLIRMRRSE